MKLAPKIGFLLNPSMPGKLKTGVIMALIILVVTCFVGYYSFQKTIDNVQLVKHTYKVKLKVEELNSAMKDVNRALSGILLRTDLVKHNDFSFYTMYREAKQNVLSKYNDVKAVTLDNTRQQKLLVTLFSIIDTRFKCTDSITVLSESKIKDSSYIATLDRGKILMNEFDTVITAVRNNENDLLYTRNEISDDSIKQSKAVIVIFMVVALTIIIVCFYLLFRSLNIIQENERLYRAIFENSHDLKCLCNNDLSIIEVNPQFVHILQSKKTEEQLYLYNFFENKEDAEWVKSVMLKGKNIKQKQLTFISDNGRKYRCITNFIIIDDKKKIYSVILTDITEQLRLQEEKEAMENFANIGRVSRMLAHEVRNPLTNINLALEGLEEENGNENLKPYFDIIDRNSTRISKLITELLNSTRPNVLEYDDINFNDLIEEIFVLAKDRINLKNISITKHIAGDLPPLKGDKEKLIIAFLNIIINAIEAMPKEDGRLFIEAFVIGDKLIHVNIGDNGIGMDAETVANIFKTFFTKKQAGTGLGLTTTQNIILTHKGKIGVNSTLGKGTVFTIQLPLQ